jgi:hypothetical protein
MQDFVDTIAVRRPQQISAAEADALIRANTWPLTLGTGSPRAAEAATDLGADGDMDAPRGILLGIALGILAWCVVGLLMVAVVAVWGLL